MTLLARALERASDACFHLAAAGQWSRLLVPTAHRLRGLARDLEPRGGPR